MGLLTNLLARLQKNREVKEKPDVGDIITRANSYDTILTDTKKIELVKSHQYLNNLIKILASQVSTLGYFPEKMVDDYQHKWWDNWFETKGVQVIREMFENSWYHGHSIAAPDIDMMIIPGSWRRVPEKLVPLNMSKIVNIDDETIQYNNTRLLMNWCMELVLYTRSGKPYPQALTVYNNVARLNHLEKSETQAHLQSIGMWQLKNDDPDRPWTPAEMATNIKLIKDIGQKGLIRWIGRGELINHAPIAIADFSTPIKRNETRIAMSVLMQWLLEGETATGTYGSVKAKLEAYGQFVNSCADAVCECLNDYAIKIASWNDEPCTITFKHDKPNIVSVESMMSAIGQAVSLDLEPEQAKVVWRAIGVPPPAHIMNPPVDEPVVEDHVVEDHVVEDHVDVKQLSNELVSYLNDKKTALKNALIRQIAYRKAGKAGRLSVSGSKHLSKDILRVTETKQASLALIFHSMQTRLNSLVSTIVGSSMTDNEIEVLFQKKWIDFTREVTEWQQT